MNTSFICIVLIGNVGIFYDFFLKVLNLSTKCFFFPINNFFPLNSGPKMLVYSLDQNHITLYSSYIYTDTGTAVDNIRLFA